MRKIYVSMGLSYGEQGVSLRAVRSFSYRALMAMVVMELGGGLGMDLAWGEYRVYEYLVWPKASAEKEGEAYTVRSTLPPKAYLAYNGGSFSVNLQTLRTWVCSGHTGFQFAHRPLCESPYKRLVSELMERAKMQGKKGR